MTVAELIAELQKMPSGAEACVLFEGEPYCVDGVSVRRAISNGDGRTFTAIDSDADARRHLARVRPIVVIE